MKKLTTPSPYMNGKHEAPPKLGGASPLRTQSLSSSALSASTPQPTRFLDEVQGVSWRTLCYQFSHQACFGIPMHRMVTWFLLLLASLWALDRLWWGCAASLLLLLGMYLTLRHLRQRDFVYFVAEAVTASSVGSFKDAPPKVSPQPFPPEHKVAIYATGQFEVEGKRRRFTMLPGFYRTFVTREHATLCQVRTRRFLGISNWPEDEVGLWYAFFSPPAIQRIRQGHIYFDRVPRHALEIRYEQALPNPRKPDNPKRITQTLYLAVDSPTVAQTILADLYSDLPSYSSPTVSLGHER